MRTPRGEGWVLPSEVEFELASGELRGPGGSTRLAPQPAALLALLAKEGGRVVSRERVRQHLWPGGHVEFDQGIAFAVAEVRRGITAVGGTLGTQAGLPVAAGRPPGGGCRLWRWLGRSSGWSPGGRVRRRFPWW